MTERTRGKELLEQTVAAVRAHRDYDERQPLTVSGLFAVSSKWKFNLTDGFSIVGGRRIFTVCFNDILIGECKTNLVDSKRFARIDPDTWYTIDGPWWDDYRAFLGELPSMRSEEHVSRDRNYQKLVKSYEAWTANWAEKAE